jgi:amphi-Trp domain-containing protein
MNCVMTAHHTAAHAVPQHARDRSPRSKPGAGVSGPVRLDAHTDAVTDFEYVERVPRQRAAERLVDVAYALAGGETLALRHDGEQVTVAVADHVLMIRRITSKGDRIEVSIELSWSSPDRADRATGE